MLQRLFLLDHLGAKRVLFSDPVEMEVKTAAAHYSAAVALWLLGLSNLLCMLEADGSAEFPPVACAKSVTTTATMWMFTFVG